LPGNDDSSRLVVCHEAVGVFGACDRGFLTRRVFLDLSGRQPPHRQNGDFGGVQLGVARQYSDNPAAEAAVSAIFDSGTVAALDGERCSCGDYSRDDSTYDPERLSSSYGAHQAGDAEADHNPHANRDRAGREVSTVVLGCHALVIPLVERMTTESVKRLRLLLMNRSSMNLSHQAWDAMGT
jgi:hypothetical protein